MSNSCADKPSSAATNPVVAVPENGSKITASMKKGEQISRAELRERAVVRQLLLTWLKNNGKMTA
jgi:hypothetical protein